MVIFMKSDGQELQIKKNNYLNITATLIYKIAALLALIRRKEAHLHSLFIVRLRLPF